jgi:hypothetical protein
MRSFIGIGTYGGCRDVFLAVLKMMTPTNKAKASNSVDLDRIECESFEEVILTRCGSINKDLQI